MRTPSGAVRIRGELLGLGIVVSSSSIRRYRRRRHSRPTSQSWRSFLSNHAEAISSADLFVVQTLTFQTLYVIFYIDHGRRELPHFEVTAHPTAASVWRQLLEATPWDRKPRCLIHDLVPGLGFRLRSAHLRSGHQEPANTDHGASGEPDRGTLGEDSPPVRDRPIGESLLTAFRRPLLDGCKNLGVKEHAGVIARAGALINASPALQTREREISARYTQLLAELLASESHTTPDSVELWGVASALMSIHRALAVYIRGRVLAGRQGPKLIADARAQATRAFARLERGLADYSIRST